MVNSLYLFIGEDTPSKDAKIRQLRQKLFTKDTEQFNLNILYARELSLKQLQERLLCLPVKAASRLIVVKNAQELSAENKKFLLRYLRDPNSRLLLVLDFAASGPRDSFIAEASKHGRIIRFKESEWLDTFLLSRVIGSGKAEGALRVLNKLLKKGEKPERLIGGLRYVYEKDCKSIPEKRRRLKLLLDCDIEIKTGKLKPLPALEKLIISLCCFGKPLC